MTSRHNDGLCRPCTKVNFHSLEEGRTKRTERETEFDVFWDLLSVLNEKNCPLCRLLISCLRNDDDFDFAEAGKFDHIYGVYAGHELRVLVKQKERTKRSSYSIQVCGDKNSQIQEHLVKIKPTTFDVKELKSWLDRCNNGHRQCSTKGDLLAKPLPNGFRLIDVKRGCIITAESDPIYCALSYVWGGGNQLTLNKQNLTTLEKEGALFGNDFLLPKSITDAIKLCKDLNQNYLWVDCLCILQDGEADKHNQVSSMDAVYNLAFLTIVAAAGDSANAGLPPFNSPRLNSHLLFHVETISGINFVSCLSPRIATEAITESKWATRGWTLQEYVLSKRTVIFTGRYVFFRCKEALWAEDFGLQFLSFRDNWPGWDLPLYRFSTTTQRASGQYLENYSQLVAQYVRRVLTKEEDILYAFLGILNRLENIIGTHLWGLPSKEFGSALLWSTNSSFSIKRRPLFPSWSWAGWIYTNGFPHEGIIRDGIYLGIGSWYEHSSILTCYNVGDDTEIQCFEQNHIGRVTSMRLRAIEEGISGSEFEIPIQKSIKEHFTPPKNYEHLLDSYISLKDRSGPPLSHYVFFWTSCSTLLVDRQPTYDREGNSSFGQFSIRLQPDSDHTIGHVRLDSEWREKQPEMLEFAVTTVGFYSGWFNYPRIALKFGLMLITSCTNTKPEAYTRVTAVQGRVELEDWIKSEPQQRLLALI
ncbi:uncharacterized protein BP5553_10462 [Venustampulla echinocandica]|uniref:Heterokaryon incompatibility domain-containing protein n=1 Tax=Venustampulla echinocandica TaxID=2656787 RepID=A0A370T9E0_9HELO|nr:uncharacterized protein BP5553_10462 [Venustampulla echinocandica]RDL30184.1 hypothetical protein BP5553_10462 [Venustampulla echinocandica]